jgi:hypothetical protein
MLCEASIGSCSSILAPEVALLTICAVVPGPVFRACLPVLGAASKERRSAPLKHLPKAYFWGLFCCCEAAP